MRLLWSLDHALQSASKRMELGLGVTGPQRLVVRMVGRFPGASPGQLAALLRLHPSTLTGILQRLVTRNVLERQSDAIDARRAHMYLTEQGSVIDNLQAGTVEATVR